MNSNELQQIVTAADIISLLIAARLTPTGLIRTPHGVIGGRWPPVIAVAGRGWSFAEERDRSRLRARAHAMYLAEAPIPAGAWPLDPIMVGSVQISALSLAGQMVLSRTLQPIQAWPRCLALLHGVYVLVAVPDAVDGYWTATYTRAVLPGWPPE